MNALQDFVLLEGNRLDLNGGGVKTGDKAPNFQVLANDLSPVTLDDFKGKTVVILSVPSLDTPVCDIETVRFNNEASTLSGDVAILAVSMDLPFAQARWCGSKGVEQVQTLSDHRDASFGEAFGVLITGLRLLARAVFIIDRDGIVRYIQLVEETTEEPDYEDALNALKTVM